MNLQEFFAPESEASRLKPKKKIITLLLLFFFCGFGAHKFYEGKIKLGILYMLTGGGFLGIGSIYDLIVLWKKPNEYYV